ncbi:MAG: acetate kinase [Spirochaetes bacterium GWD1_61_31]|nr:MAG: acetate kinase [Spirochaetes bacterium GWB1_60_80]OHD30666.1 MAG: acetate kinase [Spirochaetes bacterium GWC1_61_12]OHD36042.1 MAG: acetate kinase [Spirochaetes bacterium GWD1_61_31]OHD42441.1 MAG: acetate kinase [Spirochaetes bacterium GWE1_60_18]OHD59243.1 MAG: acetate kinase [Spirochaetes bacterium GWF1_60_12]HAP43053.1 acetate kinase [Spirochaetaceae bacterium]
MQHSSGEHCILVLNTGSSSLKYEVFLMPRRQSLGKGLVERIGESAGFLQQTSPKGEIRLEAVFADHAIAMQKVGACLVDPEKGIVPTTDKIEAIGHRIVHGGERFCNSVQIDEAVIAAIEANIELAPLHNPANLTGIQAASQLLPKVPQVAVFDTAFHQTMPPQAYLYGLPRELYDKHRIRRYGFHGTSHRYVASRALEILGRKPCNTNLITCHLGNGASITAIEGGRSIDTSMGFTPLEGLVMGTRCGDIDPAILCYLADHGYSNKEITNMLNKKSGLLGLSGISNDLRDLEAAAEKGISNALEALDVYAHRVRKYIGSYMAELFKVDALVFTGGIGQHGARMRERICHRLENINIVMDYEANNHNGSKEGLVSQAYSPTAILVIPTNEELQIAMDTFGLLFPETAVSRRRKGDVNL